MAIQRSGFARRGYHYPAEDEALPGAVISAELNYPEVDSPMKKTLPLSATFPNPPELWGTYAKRIAKFKTYAP